MSNSKALIAGFTSGLLVLLCLLLAANKRESPLMDANITEWSLWINSG
ncbi:MAG: hypothetical protein KUF74_08660 [Candidatus Thiodiazotropha sp. (ex Ctena orbiculata)]|nr:hypothetical protein [Candidatus Thiodiazotropha taylori]